MKKVKLAIVIPVFNDWASAKKLLENIASEFSMHHPDCEASVFLINDGSSEEPPVNLTLSSISQNVEVIELSLNVGHQRAISAGLNYVSHLDYDYVLVMDSDGEDTPEGAVMLLNQIAISPASVIVAQRGIRSEKWSFRAMYAAHKFIFRALIGQTLDFGNFALLPMAAVRKINSFADSSSHFPSSILRSGIELLRVRVDRGARYFGESKMNFEKLVAHSFSSLAVFSDKIMVRLMIFSFFSILASFIAITLVLITRFFTDSATPGWATAAIGLILVMSIQVLSFVGLGTLITLNLNSLKTLYRNQERSIVNKKS
jgi:glycosyltransferase involved in cell wall biosynthesis